MLSEADGEGEEKNRAESASLVDGVIGPAHVSTIVGSKPYNAFTARYRKPLVIAGFEPLDVLQSVRMLVRQLNEGRAIRKWGAFQKPLAPAPALCGCPPA